MQVIWNCALQFSIAKEVIDRSKEKGMTVPEMVRKCNEGGMILTEGFFYNMIKLGYQRIILGTIWKTICENLELNYEEIALAAFKSYLINTKDTWVYRRPEDRDTGMYVAVTKEKIKQLKEQKILKQADKIRKRLEREEKKATKEALKNKTKASSDADQSN